MFRSFKDFIASLSSSTGLQGFEGRERQLATAVLLVRVATVDREMSEARREKICALMKAHFGLDDVPAAQLIHDAIEAAGNSVDLYHFTRRLNAVLDDTGRQCAVKMMWQVIYVDGPANDFESNIIWRSADLLGVSSRQRIELRQLVVADMATRDVGVVLNAG
jgi:uncharacterized tellurite resistance protein B-like protein